MKKTILLLLLGCAISLAGCAAHKEEMVSSDTDTENTVKDTPLNDTFSDESDESTETAALEPSLDEPEEKTESAEISYVNGEFMNTTGCGQGWAAVQDNASGLWGYIDKTGNYVIQPQYAEAYPFSEGRAAVNTGNDYMGSWGFIDKDNNMVIEPKYSEVNKAFTEGYTSVRFTDEEFGWVSCMIDYNGNELAEPVDEIASTSRIGLIPENMGSDYHVIVSEENESDCVMDSNGKLVLDTADISGDENWYIHYFTENVIVVEKSVGNSVISALVDYDGNQLIDFKYKELKPFKGGSLFLARQADDTAFLIDKEGTVIRDLGMAIDMSAPVSKCYNSGISAYGLSYYDTQYQVYLYQSIELIDNQSGEIIHHIPVESRSLEHHCGSYLFFENCYAVYSNGNTYVDGFCKIYDYNGNLLLDYGNIEFSFSIWPFGDGTIEDNDDILLPVYNREKRKFSFILME